MDGRRHCKEKCKCQNVFLDKKTLEIAIAVCHHFPERVGYLEPGILKSVLGMMHSKGKSKTSGEKACILAFDVMKLDIKYAYDRTSNTFYCGKKYVQVVTARGMIVNWKQPVFNDYDRKMTKYILFEIIRSVEYTLVLKFLAQLVIWVGQTEVY